MICMSGGYLLINHIIRGDATMATRRGPRFKECRRLGVNICGHLDAMKRAETVPVKRKYQNMASNY